LTSRGTFLKAQLSILFLNNYFDHRTGQSSTQAGTEPSWGSESTGGPPGSQSYYESQQAHAQPSQPSYYDPNPQRHESGAARTHTPGYDVTWYDEPQQNPEPRTNPSALGLFLNVLRN
jgi:hypothetical protein